MAATDPIETSPRALLGLPSEIRNMIWRFAVVEDTIKFDPINGETPNPPALLEVNRQIRAEAIDIFYHENEIVWWIEDLDAAAYTRWLETSTTRMDAPISIISHGKAVWKNMLAWLKAYYQGLTLGIESSDDGALLMNETAAQMFVVVEDNHQLGWDKLLPILQSMRKVAGAHDAEWLKDD